jgi:predicted nucleotidyltransferase
MESRKSQKLKELQKRLKRLLDKDIHDMIIFGSYAKGKAMPNDIDLYIISDNEKIKPELKKILPDADIQFMRKEDIYNPIWSVLISEGFSVKKNEFISKLHKIEPVTLFKYSLKKFTPVQKVQFTRGLKSIIKETNGKKLMRTVVILPLTKSQEFEDFLRTWNISFETMSYDMLPRLRKEDIV